MTPEDLFSNPVFLWMGPALLGLGIACARKASLYVETAIFDAAGGVGIVGGIVASFLGAWVYSSSAPFGEGAVYTGTFLLIALVVVAAAYVLGEIVIKIAEDDGGFPYTLKKGRKSSSTASFGAPTSGASDEEIMAFAEERTEDLADIFPEDGVIWDTCREHVENLTETVLPELLETRERLREDVEYANRVVSSDASATETEAGIRKSANQRSVLISLFNDVERKITECLSFLAHANLDVRIAIRSGETAGADLEQRLKEISEEITVNVDIEQTVREEMSRLAGKAT